MTEVYVAKIPFGRKRGEIVPSERNGEIEACGNERVRGEKRAVWNLLEYALGCSFGLKMNAVRFRKSKNGKWDCDKCRFSLTHGGGACAVALSDSPVGVDIELVAPLRFTAALQKKILTAREAEALSRLSDAARAEQANALFTVKEAIFKRGGGAVFTPSAIDADGERAQTKRVIADGREYFLSVACSDGARVKFVAVGDCMITER